MRVLPNTNSSATPMSNSFMPTSVIRHLTKQNAEEKATNHFESKIAQKSTFLLLDKPRFNLKLRIICRKFQSINLISFLLYFEILV